MKISKNKFVSLTYILRLNGFDGEIVEETEKEHPLEFIFGSGKMIQMFERQLEGLEKGNDFKFEIKAEDAYGEANDENIVDLPKDLFKVKGVISDEMLTIGNSIPMQDPHGNRFTGIVLEVGDNTVKIDFNHPLAGDDLYFSGTVLEVREATAEEINNSCTSDCSSCCHEC